MSKCDLPRSARVIGICAGRSNVDTDYRYRSTNEYMFSSIDFAKALNEAGFEVNFEHDRADRQEMILKSREIWVPIILMSLDVLRDVGIGVLANVITNWIGIQSLQEASLHVQIEVELPTGERTTFAASGLAREVLKSQQDFESEVLHRYISGN